MKSSRGGARPGAGKKKGTLWKSTITKQLAREEARLHIQAHLPRMFNAQIEAACGVAHLMLRNTDGTWQKAPERITAEEIELVLNGDPNRYFIATKDPNTQAFTILAAYALDKPAEQVKVTGADDGPIEHVFRWQK